MLFVISPAMSILGIPALTKLHETSSGYLPKVIAALLIFLVATAAAGAVVHRTMGTPTGKVVRAAVPARFVRPTGDLGEAIVGGRVTRRAERDQPAQRLDPRHLVVAPALVHLQPPPTLPVRGRSTCFAAVPAAGSGGATTPVRVGDAAAYVDDQHECGTRSMNWPSPKL